MRSILRFLCVVIMLHVATPLVHGMRINDGDVEAQNDEVLGAGQHLAINEETPLLDGPSTGLERMKEIWPSAGFQKIKKFLKSDAGCCTGTLVLTVVTIVILGLHYGLAPGDTKQGNHEHNNNTQYCPECPWNSLAIPCGLYTPELPDYPPPNVSCWAVNKCQERLSKEKCVPFCTGFLHKNHKVFQTGWNSTTQNCSTEFENPFLVVCGEQEAESTMERLTNEKIEFCSFEIDNDIAIVVSSDNKNETYNASGYEQKILPHSHYMKTKCDDIQNKAQKLNECQGPVTARYNSQKRKKVVSKNKTRRRKAQ